MDLWGVSFGDAGWWLSTTGLQVGVGVASCRRCRCLSGYPVWQSLLTALLAATFWALWVIIWALNFRDVAEDWEAYRAGRSRGGRAGGDLLALHEPGRATGSPPRTGMGD